LTLKTTNHAHIGNGAGNQTNTKGICMNTNMTIDTTDALGVLSGVTMRTLGKLADDDADLNAFYARLFMAAVTRRIIDSVQFDSVYDEDGQKSSFEFKLSPSFLAGIVHNAALDFHLRFGLSTVRWQLTVPNINMAIATNTSKIDWLMQAEASVDAIHENMLVAEVLDELLALAP